jgi:hypothetical protein
MYIKNYIICFHSLQVISKGLSRIHQGLISDPINLGSLILQCNLGLTYSLGDD